MKRQHPFIHPPSAIRHPILLSFISPAWAAIENPAVPSLGSGDPGGALATVIANAWQAAVVVGGLLFIAYFVWGAMRWMTAEGDKAKFESGREKMQNAAIGLVLLAASVAIIQLLGSLLDIPFLETLTFDFPTAP